MLPQELQGILKWDTTLTYGMCSDSKIVLAALTGSGGWMIYVLVMCLQDQGITERFPRASG